MNNLFQASEGLHGLAFNVLPSTAGSIKYHQWVASKQLATPRFLEFLMTGGISHNAWIFIPSQELK